MDDLSKKIKVWESNLDHTLNADLPVVCRIDGHRFSQFTKHFNRPFDERFHLCMLATANDLMQFFPECKFIYTQSDEISLFFQSLQCFKARVQKLVSLSAAFTAVRFDHHFSEIAPDLHRDHGGQAHFDSRVFNVDNQEALYDVYKWRYSDAQRNSKLAFGLQLFTQREIHKLSSHKIVEKAASQGKDFQALVPIWAREGTSISRKRVVQTAINRKTLEEKEYSRGKISVTNHLFGRADFICLFSSSDE